MVIYMGTFTHYIYSLQEGLMKNNALQKPLVQSALVLLAAILLIGFVAGSGADSFFGGIVSIFKGVLYTILFAFALIVALVFSTLVLFALYIASVAIYSPQLAKENAATLRQRLLNLYLSWTSCYRSSPQYGRKQESQTPPVQSSEQVQRSFTHHESPSATEDVVQSVRREFADEIAGIKNSMTELNNTNDSLNASLTELQTSMAGIPADDLGKRTEELERNQKVLEQQLTDCSNKITELTESASQGEQISHQQGKKLDGVVADLGSLKSSVETLTSTIEQLKSTSAPQHSDIDLDHRIFTYLEQHKDKIEFAQLIAEAVQQNMTYAEIDDFLSESLSDEIDAIIKEHPSLTKEYIRELKNR
ncbi:MAG: hypothetical protein ABR512_08040 [Desulfopila sp.]